MEENLHKTHLLGAIHYIYIDTYPKAPFAFSLSLTPQCCNNNARFTVWMTTVQVKAVHVIKLIQTNSSSPTPQCKAGRDSESVHPPEGNLEGRGVQNPRTREISRAEGGVFSDTSRLEAVYGHSFILDREGLDLTLSGSRCVW